MKPTLKRAGLALVVVLAASAISASTASAKAFVFKSAVAHTELKGEQLAGTTDVFHLDAGTFACPTITYDGTANATSVSEVTIEPTYPLASGAIPCELKIGEVLVGRLEIELNGCDYVFTTKTLEGGNYEGSFDIACPIGSAGMTATAKLAGITKCIIHIPPQTNVGTITYTNVSPVGKPKHIHLDMNFSGITYTQTAGLGAGKCTDFGNTHTANGSYTGTATLKGFDTAGVQQNIFVE